VKLASVSKGVPCRAWEGPTPAGGLPCEGMGDALRELERLGAQAD